MKVLNRLALIVVFWGTLFTLQAQQDSIAMYDSLAVVEIEAFTLSKTVSGGSSTIDVMPAIGVTNNLVGILNYSTAPIVRSYGAGASSSLSFRGLGPNHSQVLWNGLTLNSPMLGQADLSIVPGFFFDKVEIATGSSMTNASSDAIGGAVNLISSTPKDSLGWKVITSFGSYGSFVTGLQLNKKWKKLTLDTRFITQQAKNDIRYKDATQDSLPIRRMTNSSFKQIGIQQLIAIDFTSKWKLVAVANYLSAFRYIAPSIVSSDSGSESQADQNFRAVAELKGQIGTNDLLLFRSGFIRDFIRYQDTVLKLDEPSVFWASRNLIQYKHFLKKGEFQLSLLADYDEASIEHYAQKVSRLRTAASALFQHKIFGRNSGQILLKMDGSEQFGYFFLPSAGVSFLLHKKLNSALKFEYSKSLKLPTFNDLYWSPGGNSALLPEISENVELTLNSTIFKFKKAAATIQFSGFYTDVINWILWTPGQSFWSASNVWHVNNTGLESSLNFRYVFKKVFVSTTMGYNFQNPVVIEDKSNAIETNNVLPYVPRNQMHVNFSADWKKWTLALNHQYQGKRFTTSENTFYLPYYQLTNAVLSYGFAMGEYKFNMNVECRNVTNANYYSLAWRPMPGRWWQVTIQIALR